MMEKQSSIKWGAIKVLGDQKILRTSYIFFVCVPFFAKMLYQIPAQIDVPLFDQKINIDLELPFSWIAFFWASFFGSIGHIIYAVRCPYVVKEFEVYQDFVFSQRNGKYLEPMLREIAGGDLKNTTLECLKKLLGAESKQIDPYVANAMIIDETPVSAELFYFVRDSAEMSRDVSRRLACLFYGVAFIFLAYVLMQNLLFVLRLLY